MVLFTLLGLCALFLRDRKNSNIIHSGQDENVDQSDDLPPLERDDGQTSRDLCSDPVVLPTTEEPITGDSQVDDDWSQDHSLEEPIIGDPQDGDDWSKHQSLEEPIIDDAQDGDDWSNAQSLEEPIIGDPQDGDDWSKHQSLEEPIIDDAQDGDDWSNAQSLEEPIIGDPEDGDDWSKDQSLEEPIIDDPQDGDDWSKDQSLEEPSIGDPQDGDDWSENLSLEEPIIDDAQDGDDWSNVQSLEEPIIGDPQDGDDWSNVQSLEEPIIGDPQDGDDWSKDQSLEEPISGDPQDGDDWSNAQSLEEPSIGDPEDGDDWSENLSLEEPIIDDAQDGDDRSNVQSLEEPIIGDPQDGDDWSNVQSLEEPIIGDPQDGDDWSKDQSLEEPISGDPQDGDDWSKDESLEEPSIGDPEDGDDWSENLSLEEPSIGDPQDDDDSSEYQSVEELIIDDPQDDDDSSEYQSVEELIIDDPQDDDDSSEYQSVEELIIDDPQDDDDSSEYQSVEELIIDDPQDDDDSSEYQSVEELIIDDPQDDDDSSEYQSVEELIIDDPQDDDDSSEYQSVEELIIDDPQDDDDSSEYQSLEEPVTGNSQVNDDCSDDVYYSPPEDTVAPQLSQLKDITGTIIEINSKKYQIGNQLGEGGFGAVFEATRLEDDVQVAVKFTSKENAEYVSVHGYSTPLPKEVALHILVNEPRVPQIIQLLDWQDQDDNYIMVLERPMPCQSLFEFLESYKGAMDEKDLAWIIMPQVALAAQICCQRGVLHRDIKPENLLINPDTLEVKLIDFGCGDFLHSADYTSFTGTEEYCPPEYKRDGRYHAEPATVWSLGVLLYEILFWDCPGSSDLDLIQDDGWTKDGLSQKCCDFICSCLRFDPKKRIKLEDVLLHDWLKINEEENNDDRIMEINSKKYQIGNQLGYGGFGAVFEATRLEDDVQVAVKFASKKNAQLVSVHGYSIPLPMEVALHIPANEPRVPQIIQLLDWQEQVDNYIMVFERPMPCQSLDEFLDSYKGPMNEEDLARVIMSQVALAAQICCQRGVFHRDIKPQNLLINPDTLEVKLIDFGCGAFLNSTGYTSYSGTKKYHPPEFKIDGRYHGEPATVWSLGIVLFLIVGWTFPSSSDLDLIQDDSWTKDGLSQECCDFICSCLRLDPKKRIKLEDVLLHDWFKMNEVENNDDTIMGQSGTVSRLTMTENCRSSPKPPDKNSMLDPRAGPANQHPCAGPAMGQRTSLPVLGQRTSTPVLDKRTSSPC